MTGIYSDLRCLEHYAPGHPESPDRLRAAVAGLQNDPDGPAYRWPEVHPAELLAIAAVHPERHIRRVAELAQSGGGWMDPDTFVVPPSFDAARLATGAMLQAVDDVMQGAEDNAFVVVRPPGHHATGDRAMGFCLFNTVAIGAQWALAEGGAGSVAILDVDVHHGNGTQDIFFARPDVFYYSTHQYPFYPGTGQVRDVGTGDGAGTTVNVPLMPGCGDATFWSVTEQILDPALRRFAPDLILVSVGFDAHWADPLAHMRLTTQGYAEILLHIRALADQLCGGRLIFLLEGGYDLQVIEESTRMAGRVLAGQQPSPGMVGAPPPAPEPGAAAAVIAAVREVHNLSEGTSR